MTSFPNNGTFEEYFSAGAAKRWGEGEPTRGQSGCNTGFTYPAYSVHASQNASQKEDAQLHSVQMPTRGSILQRSSLSLCSAQSGLTAQGGCGRGILGDKLYRDPSLGAGSQHASCDDASMTDSGQHLGVAKSCQRENCRLSQDLMDRDPCSRAAAELLEGSESGGEVDERNISPCRQAATELMGSSCPPDSEQGDATSQGVYGSLSQQGGEGNRTSAVQIPGLESQPDWFTLFLEQAQSVGLWGSGMERPSRAASPLGGRPILSDSLLEWAVTGARASRPPPPPPRRTMPALKEERDTIVNCPAIPGTTRTQATPVVTGLLPLLEPLGGGSHCPRFSPVSLGMTAATTVQGGQPSRHGSLDTRHLNDGPFRPPTNRPARDRLGQPMLLQSHMQLSLGLGADSAINFKAWEYGEASGGASGLSCDNSSLAGVESSLRKVPDVALPQAASKPHAALLAVPEMPEIDRPCNSSAEVLPLRCSVAASPPSSPTLHGQRSPSFAAVLAAAQQHQQQQQAQAHGTQCQGITSPKAPVSDGWQEFTSQEAGGGGGSGQALQQCAGMGRTSEEGLLRAECLERYREKKRRRLYSKTIRYHKRKVNADRRPRVKGRFVKATGTGEGAPEGKDQPPDMTQEGHIILEYEADEVRGTEWPDAAHMVSFNSGHL